MITMMTNKTRETIPTSRAEERIQAFNAMHLGYSSACTDTADKYGPRKVKLIHDLVKQKEQESLNKLNWNASQKTTATGADSGLGVRYKKQRLQSAKHPRF
jgi:DNA-directed RNA polymerase beta subunit